MSGFSKRALSAVAYTLIACQAVAGAALEFGAFY